MRKYIFSALALLSSIGLGAQSMMDAYTFGATEYLGTARVVGLGGAVGALGSDLGTVTVNPAGSAVAGYSQFVISPSLSTSLTNTTFSLDPTSDGKNANSVSRTRFKLPNIGLSSRYSTGVSGISMTLGVVLNTTYDYNYEHEGYGLNGYASKFAEMARAADGLTAAQLESSSFYDNYPDLWDVGMGYKAGLINGYGTANQYVGCTEVLTDDDRRYVPSDLMQRSRTVTSGYKTDLILNAAWNFDDKFYLGFNLGLPILSYSNVERYSEVAQTVEDFPVRFNYDDGTVENTYFDNAVYQYNYIASGSGLYGKVGVIWLPVAGLRLGFAYQTPTIMDIREYWQHSGKVNYANGTSFSASSPEGTYEYSVRTPRHFDFSAAYTFGRLGLISVDGSIENYSCVKFSDVDGTSTFDFLNAATKAFSGRAYELRVGAEVNVAKNFAVRAGWNMKTSAEKYYTVDGEPFYYEDYNDDYYVGRKSLPGNGQYVNDIRSSYSIGLGYNPAGSFFADFAVRYTRLPETSYQPFYSYDDVYSPVFYSTRSRINAVLTLGFRF